MFRKLKWARKRLAEPKKVKRLNTGCIVARGACSAYVDLSGTTKIYDVQAGVFILQEAGGLITDLEGNLATESEQLIHGLVATNHAIHSQLLSTLGYLPPQSETNLISF